MVVALLYVYANGFANYSNSNIRRTNMKKLVTILAITVVLGLAVLQTAEAGWGWWGRGGERGYGRGYGPGDCGGPRYGRELDEKEIKARDDFFNETKDMRRDLFDKRQEYAALMDQENPDKDKAAQLWSEIFDLQAKLQEKAGAAGFGPRSENRRRGYGSEDCGVPGCGNGPRGGYGYGPGDCGGGPGCGGPRGGGYGPRWDR